MELQGSSAIVAGGASGLGEATARMLHERGARVTVADVNVEQGRALARELGVEFLACDVREEEQVGAAVAQAAAHSGGLRIAVCCAGVGWAQKLTGRDGPHPLEAFERTIAINLTGTFNLLRLAAAAMARNEPADDGERGVCINTASIAAYDGQIGQAAYAASKGAIVAMTLPAARELSRYGIRVNAIAPGLFDTPLLAALPQQARERLAEGVPFPPRLGAPREYAQLACQIIENRMLNGETIRLDGALRMAPG